LSSTCEHCHEKRCADPDHNKGPKETPIQRAKDLPCQRQEPEGYQYRASNKGANVGTICLHIFSFQI
jgi:hypothetical protein